MNKLMAKNIQRDLSEAKTVRQSLDAMGRAISMTVGCQMSTGRRQKRLELLSWITLAVVVLICFFEFSRTVEADDPGVRLAKADCFGMTGNVQSSYCFPATASTIASKATGMSDMTASGIQYQTGSSQTAPQSPTTSARSAATRTRPRASTLPSCTTGSTIAEGARPTERPPTGSTATCRFGTASRHTRPM